MTDPQAMGVGVLLRVPLKASFKRFFKEALGGWGFRV